MAGLSTPSEAETRGAWEMIGVAAAWEPQVAPAFPSLMGPPRGVELHLANKSHSQQTTVMGVSIIGDEELGWMIRDGKIPSRAVARPPLGEEVPKP